MNGEIFYSPKEAKAVIGQWRNHYNTASPAHRWDIGRPHHRQLAQSHHLWIGRPQCNSLSMPVVQNIRQVNRQLGHIGGGAPTTHNYGEFSPAFQKEAAAALNAWIRRLRLAGLM